MNRFVLLPSISALVAWALAACGGQAAEAPSATGPQRGDRPVAVAHGAADAERAPRRDGADRPQGTADASGPSIEIVKPADGQTVRGGALTVSVSVKRFEVVNQRVRPPFPAPVAGQGHVHFYLDTKMLPTTHSPPTTGAYRSVSDTAYTWTGVDRGRRSVAVQLVGKDHAPLRPAVKDRMTVDVE